MNDQKLETVIAEDTTGTFTDTRRTCVHCHPVSDGRGQEQLECRRFPPVAQLMVEPPKVVGGSPTILKQTFFPNCANLCGEYKEIKDDG